MTELALQQTAGQCCTEDLSASLGIRTYWRTGDQQDTLYRFETVVHLSEKQFGNGCNLDACATEV